MASFRSQYGIRLRKEASEMPWDEFCDLINGLDPDTPLGRMVRIRTETDADILKEYTPELRKIRNEWQNKQAKHKSADETKAFLENMKQAFIAMAGGEKKME